MITTIIRTVILYIFVTFAIRVMGKRQIGDMQPNELVITLLISEIVAIPLQDISQPILSGVVAIFMLIVLEIVMSVLSMKSLRVRKFMSGNSVVIINNGVVDQNAMKNVRMTVLDLIEQLRGQNVFDISTVAFAVLEVNGELSVLLKGGDQPLTAKDMSIKKDKAALPLPVISDGKILNDSLRALKIDEEAVNKKLRANQTELTEVFLMTLDRYDNIQIVKKGC
ncbi:MAG: DUF421 domain-containing protein [Clostridia bacterium]|nr:DUF421 domain-containing protein [Clostridia bacterium]MBR6564476.1 DUF421 domain-containing protein [Clostridia bacterium]